MPVRPLPNKTKRAAITPRKTANKPKRPAKPVRRAAPSMRQPRPNGALTAGVTYVTSVQPGAAKMLIPGCSENLREPIKWTTASRAAPGTIILEHDICPSAFDQTRVSRFAKLFQKFRFRNLRVKVTPGVTTGASGTYIHGFITDPLRPIGARPDLLLGATKGAVEASYSAESEARMPNDGASRWFYTDPTGPDPREYFQGKYLLVVQNPLTGVTEPSTGTAKMLYDVEFADPTSVDDGLSGDNIGDFLINNINIGADGKALATEVGVPAAWDPVYNWPPSGSPWQYNLSGIYRIVPPLPTTVVDTGSGIAAFCRFYNSASPTGDQGKVKFYSSANEARNDGPAVKGKGSSVLVGQTAAFILVDQDNVPVS